MKKIYRNRKAVSNVIGTMMMLAIMVPAITIFSLSFTNIMTTQRAMIDGQVILMQEFIEYMDDIYFFFSPEPESDNHAPNITNEYPSNNAIDIDLKPECSVNISDQDGDMVAISFFQYVSGSWERMSETLWRNCNATYTCDFVDATMPRTTYYWYVNVFDGMAITTSDIYCFTTKLEPVTP